MSFYLYLTENYKADILAHEFGLNVMVYVKQMHSEFILGVCCLISHFIRKKGIQVNSRSLHTLFQENELHIYKSII